MTHFGHLLEEGLAGWELPVGVSHLIEVLLHNRYLNTLATIYPAAAT